MSLKHFASYELWYAAKQKPLVLTTKNEEFSYCRAVVQSCADSFPLSIEEKEMMMNVCLQASAWARSTDNRWNEYLLERKLEEQRRQNIQKKLAAQQAKEHPEEYATFSQYMASSMTPEEQEEFVEIMSK